MPNVLNSPALRGFIAQRRWNDGLGNTLAASSLKKLQEQNEGYYPKHRFYALERSGIVWLGRMQRLGKHRTALILSHYLVVICHP